MPPERNPEENGRELVKSARAGISRLACLSNFHPALETHKSVFSIRQMKKESVTSYLHCVVSTTVLSWNDSSLPNLLYAVKCGNSLNFLLISQSLKVSCISLRPWFTSFICYYCACLDQSDLPLDADGTLLQLKIPPSIHNQIRSHTDPHFPCTKDPCTAGQWRGWTKSGQKQREQVYNKHGMLYYRTDWPE